jgi:hypothetical protein
METRFDKVIALLRELERGVWCNAGRCWPGACTRKDCAKGSEGTRLGLLMAPKPSFVIFSSVSA